MNQYQLNYQHSDATTLTLDVVQQANATKYANQQVNANDQLQAVYIYNAAALTLSANTYAVTVTDLEGKTTAFNDALYETTSDRIVFSTIKGQTIWLPSVKTITFTKK